MRQAEICVGESPMLPKKGFAVCSYLYLGGFEPSEKTVKNCVGESIMLHIRIFYRGIRTLEVSIDSFTTCVKIPT